MPDHQIPLNPLRHYRFCFVAVAFTINHKYRYNFPLKSDPTAMLESRVRAETSNIVRMIGIALYHGR